jgi:hypothetical protein
VLNTTLFGLEKHYSKTVQVSGAQYDCTSPSDDDALDCVTGFRT